MLYEVITEFGTRTELKNMNSFRNVQLALEYEVRRQRDLLLEGGEVIQQTLLWDADRVITSYSIHYTKLYEEVHRDQREFPEDVEQKQILRQEDTGHTGFEHQEENHEVLDAVFDGRPCREDRDGGQEGSQQEQEDAEPVHSQVILDVPTGHCDPIILGRQLQMRAGSIEHRQDP